MPMMYDQSRLLPKILYGVVLFAGCKQLFVLHTYIHTLQLVKYTLRIVYHFTKYLVNKHNY